jgi:predicted NUDIX family phosphoesterase
MEFVYVVPRRDLFADCYPQGFRPFGGSAADAALPSFLDAVAKGFFVERPHAEQDPELQQIIPYSIVVRDGDVLLLRRLSKGGEARLHNKLSIGVGGHINPEDLEGNVTDSGRNPAGLLKAGSLREIHEELTVEGEVDVQYIGILNDDSNPVGAVHVGLVQLLRVTGDVSIREEDTLEGTFVEPAELLRRLGEGANFETWSAILVEKLQEILPSPTTCSPA